MIKQKRNTTSKKLRVLIGEILSLPGPIFFLLKLPHVIKSANESYPPGSRRLPACFWEDLPARTLAHSAPPRLHADRIARGHCDYFDSGRHVAARAQPGQGEGPDDLLPEQPQANWSGDHDVRR